MADKFGRTYSLKVKDLRSGNFVTVGMPFTIKFNVNRRMWGTPSSAVIKIYNLNENTRSFLRKDENDWGIVKVVSLYAGYGDDLSLITRGSVFKAYSERNGVDVVTTLEIFDGGAAFTNAYFDGQFKEGTQGTYILKAIAKSLEQFDVQVGAISKSFDRKIKRGNSYSGNSMDLINELSGGNSFVDNGKLNVIVDDEYLSGDVLNVNSATGLLGMPRIDWNNITLTMLMEPRAYLGQLVRVQVGKKEFDGLYAIRTIDHEATISEVIGESATTVINCVTAKDSKGVRIE